MEFLCLKSIFCDLGNYGFVGKSEEDWIDDWKFGLQRSNSSVEELAKLVAEKKRIPDIIGKDSSFSSLNLCFHKLLLMFIYFLDGFNWVFRWEDYTSRSTIVVFGMWLWIRLIWL